MFVSVLFLIPKHINNLFLFLLIPIIILEMLNILNPVNERYFRYLLEQSLSVDNLFVFVLVFKYFKVPTTYQVLVQLFLLICKKLECGILMA